MGRRGDSGCDGIAENGSILYACYGSRATTGIGSKTKKKLLSDFNRALENWDTFTTWRFVTNAQFGTEPTKALLTLRREHWFGSERPLNIEIWIAPDDLWEKALTKLTLEQLNEILPGVPHSQNVQLADLVELLKVLETRERKASEATDQIKPVPSSKIDYNKISQTTCAEFKEGRLLSPRIDQWFNQQSDPSLRDAKALRFRSIYEEARKISDDPREIVEYIYVALAGKNFRMDTKRANAAYAVTVYFFDSCDIFEEPPTDGKGAINVIANEGD
jgi:hypothetical protein